MWIVRQAVSCLAVVAAAGLHVGAHAREVAAAVDVLRAAGESVYPIGGDASDGALPYMAEIGLQGGISNAEDWRLFSGVPVIGVIKTDEGSRVIHLSNYFKSDRRIVKKDEAYEESGLSYFAAVTDKVSKPVIFLFDVDSDGFLLQAVETIKSRPITDGMFFGAHNDFESDVIYEGFVRLMVQKDAELSIIWQVVNVDGKRYLQVKENRAISTAGWYLAVPPDSKRNKHSNYLAITPEFEKAMPVTIEAYTDQGK